MGIGISRIGQTLSITKKLLTIYGERGTAIGRSQTLVLDAKVRYKVMVKNLTPEYLQTIFTNRNAVDNHI